MKPRERGFTLIELMVSISITVLASATAVGAIYQIFKGTEHNNDRLTVVRQVENAGYWISRDVQMANIVTTNLTSPDFLLLKWSEWDNAGNSVNHSANYTFAGLTGGVGTLKRRYWSSAGVNQTSLVAQYIYYNPSDTDNTSRVNYQSPPVLTVQLTARFEGIQETREYRIKRRPNF